MRCQSSHDTGRNAPAPFQGAKASLSLRYALCRMYLGTWGLDKGTQRGCVASRLTTRGGTPLPPSRGRKLRFRCATRCAACTWGLGEVRDLGTKGRLRTFGVTDTSAPRLLVSSSPRLLVSSSPRLLVSLSPYFLLPISSSPPLLVSLSPYLPISLSPYTISEVMQHLIIQCS